LRGRRHLFLIGDVVAVEDVSRRTSADAHGFEVLEAGLLHVADRAPAQIVEEKSWDASIARHSRLLYGDCMARFVSTTVRLGEEDVRALKRARAEGLSASDLIRKGLRVVASRYYSGRRPPSTLLFESTNSKLGDESELFRDIES
jgi:Arc/MetJ-type ribon-helix-helix transcriptional regulator